MNKNEIIKFGRININGTNYDLSWRILDVKEDKALVISNEILPNIIYSKKKNTYYYSKIRRWLNEEFYENCFSKNEKEIILDSEIDDIFGESDYIFLLHENELNNYFEKPVMIEEPFDLTFIKRYEGKDRTAKLLCPSSSKTTIGYWVRPAQHFHSQDRSSYVNLDGILSDTLVDDIYIGVRPACWIKIFNK